MGIKKERDLHKDWYENQFPTLYGLYLNNIDEAIGSFKSSEETWLAAKQQAVPDGFVVVPVEPTKEMVESIVNVKYSLSRSIYKTMIQEAQK